jgi:hypothetical protein
MAEENGKPKNEADPSDVDSADGQPIDRHPGLRKYALLQGPWSESNSRWFEAVTGEKDTFLAGRDPDL